MEIKLVNTSYKNTLENINIGFKKGINSIIGKNKTLILDILSGLIKDKGQIKIDSKVISKDLNKYVSYVLEFPEEQFFNNTVLEELKCGKKITDEEIENVLTIVGLNKELLELNPFNLSSGEKRKLGIASILLDDKDIILFNEPTIGLDNIGIESIIKLFRDLKSKGKIVIIASSNIEFVHKVSDYIYLIEENVVLEGTKYEVLKSTDNLISRGIELPQIITFSNLVLKEKNIKIGYRDDIKDLIKDIYRYVK